MTTQSIHHFAPLRAPNVLPGK